MVAAIMMDDLENMFTETGLKYFGGRDVDTVDNCGITSQRKSCQNCGIGEESSDDGKWWRLRMIGQSRCMWM